MPPYEQDMPTQDGRVAANKWTGGPWQSQHDFDREGEYTIIGNVDGEYIDGYQHNTYTTVAEVYDNGNPGEDRANARLIAAAPDLYEALTAATAMLADYVHSCGGIYDERDQEVLAAARVALAKAGAA